MQLSEFDYILPKELIAQTPIYPRDNSRLLIVDKNTGELENKHFYNLLDFLGENDVLVINKTKVINARLKGKIVFGGDCEIFLHKQISDNTWDCLIYPGKKLKIGTEIIITNSIERQTLKAKIISISDSGRIVEFNIGGIDFLKIIEIIGETPLPPYIKEHLEDRDRYQTVFSKESGSVAAPTAGLHFTPELIEKLKNKGVKIEEVLLHIGLGTFKGVESSNILEHKMHSEYIQIEKDTAERLNNYKTKGKKITAVGTTSIRVIESFTDNNGVLGFGEKDTSIFIYPGYNWKFIDNLITNFHLPKSTLLMLVSALAGIDNIKTAYEYAVKNKYRFFSFGDAMFIKDFK